MICDRVDCEREATLFPVLVLRASPKAVAGVDAAEANLALGVCAVCAKKLGTDDFITDDSWRRLARHFLRSGKQAPRRKWTTVRFDPLDDTETPRG